MNEYRILKPVKVISKKGVEEEGLMKKMNQTKDQNILKCSQ
jgi:hypothetical protein